MYLVWGRKADDPDALWFDLPTGKADSRYEAERLLDIYASKWGSMYELEVHQSGCYPKGTRQPCFVPGYW